MKTITLISSLMFIAMSGFSQGGDEPSFKNMNIHVREMQIENMHDGSPLPESVEGSPYLSDQYVPSKIFFKGQSKPLKAELRYNAYSDNFEFVRNGRPMVISNESDIDSVAYRGEDFVYTTFRNEADEQAKGFLARLVKGKCSLYKLYTREFYQAEQAETGYDEAEPPRFEAEDPTYLIELENDKMPHPIKSFWRSRFLNYFGDLEPELKDYIKDQNIRLRQEEDLVRFLRYYNRNY